MSTSSKLLPFNALKGRNPTQVTRRELIEATLRAQFHGDNDGKESQLSPRAKKKGDTLLAKAMVKAGLKRLEDSPELKQALKEATRNRKLKTRKAKQAKKAQKVEKSKQSKTAGLNFKEQEDRSQASSMKTKLVENPNSNIFKEGEEKSTTINPQPLATNAADLPVWSIIELVLQREAAQSLLISDLSTCSQVSILTFQ